MKISKVRSSSMRVFPKSVDGVLGFYTEMIDYDRDGIQVGEPRILPPLYTMGFSDGSPVTNNDIKEWEK